MSRLDELIAEAERLREEANEAAQRANMANEAVLLERFKDFERFKEGDMILVPRKLFGETHMWPARVERVHLKYNSGTYAHGPQEGESWESQSIAYTVRLRKQDGTFNSTTEGRSHHEVQAAGGGY